MGHEYTHVMSYQMYLLSATERQQDLFIISTCFLL